MENGVSSAEPNKRIKMKYTEHEKKHRMSMWHTERYETPHPRWRGIWLIAYIDGS